MRNIYVAPRVQFCLCSAVTSCFGGLALVALPVFLVVGMAVAPAHAQSLPTAERSASLTFPANLDGGFRQTQFFTPAYNTGVIQWDSRVELWLPPGRGSFSWGPYLRAAGIAGSKNDAWQNQWIAEPGVGLQMFPFSAVRFRGEHSKIGSVLGPLRAFGEYNFVNYWGAANTWRPRNQVLAGFDYWKAMHVNDYSSAWWAELWNGVFWKSSNEFTDRYDSIVDGHSVRLGLRAPNHGAISALTPYLLAQSSRTKYDYAGQTTDFYWENGLVGGGGVRLAPRLRGDLMNSRGVTRLLIYGEYLNTALYYVAAAPSSVPRYDVRAGVSVSIGDWFNQ
jgi:hypothetical protein